MQAYACNFTKNRFPSRYFDVNFVKFAEYFRHATASQVSVIFRKTLFPFSNSRFQSKTRKNLKDLECSTKINSPWALFLKSFFLYMFSTKHCTGFQQQPAFAKIITQNRNSTNLVNQVKINNLALILSNSIHWQFHILKLAITSLFVNIIFPVLRTLCYNFVELRGYHFCLLLDWIYDSKLQILL